MKTKNLKSLKTKNSKDRINTSITIDIHSIFWSDNSYPPYTLRIDGVRVLQSHDFKEIEKEIKKHLKLRFKV